MRKSNVMWGVAIFCLLASATANAAIVYLGSDVTTGPSWRTSSVAKSSTFDPNGDGGYGTDGNYVLYMQNYGGPNLQILSNVPPAFASLSEPSGVSKYANPVYGRFDDPASPIGTETWTADVGFFYNYCYDTSYVDLLNITLTSDANFVLGTIIGGNNAVPTEVRVQQTVGGSAEASADTSGTPATTGGRKDYYFFNISGVAGDTFVVSGLNTDWDAAIDGFTFESIPSAIVDVTWTGVSSTAWNTSATGNWKNGGGATAIYGDGANVTFDDTASGTTADISTADVSPASVTFNNATKNFAISGSKGIIGAATVLKKGAAKVTMSSINSYSGLTTVEGGTLQLNGTGAQNPVLNLGGSNIKAGKMVFDYNGGTSPAATIKNLLTASYNAGAWNTGKFKSTTAGTSRSLGWKDSANQVTVMYTVYGDADLSGTTNATDLNTVLSFYNTSDSWNHGDFNYDGSVNATDLNTVLSFYNQGISAAGGVGAAVPEPGTLVLLAAGLVGLLVYAWHKRT